MLPKLHLSSNRGGDSNEKSGGDNDSGGGGGGGGSSSGGGGGGGILRSMTSRKESRDQARARDEEKSRLMAWEADKRTLEYDQILVDPSRKPVGHSSKVLRREDFEMVKTLGTGMLTVFFRGPGQRGCCLA